MGHHRDAQRSSHHRGERRQSARWLGRQRALRHRRRPRERGAPRAETARILVGTDDPSEQTHPLIPTVTPDGREVVVPNVRADNVSIVSLEHALAGHPGAEVARIPLVRPDGQPARPKGSAITADGRYAVISGGPSSPPFSQELGHLYVIDLRTRRVVATVTGVGHEPYALAFVQR